MKRVYFISGLGADKRAFSFLDLSFCQPTFIEWIKPREKERLKEYALRLKQQIPDPHPVIVGVSFGGMLATEMAKADPAVRAIIISSNKTKKEFPKTLRIGKYIPAYKWLPKGIVKNRTVFHNLLFGPVGEKQKDVLNAILRDVDWGFTKWAIKAILGWKNNTLPGNLIHIHGTADKLLPFRLVKADYAIEGGTHLMIMNHAAEISALLKKII